MNPNTKTLGVSYPGQMAAQRHAATIYRSVVPQWRQWWTTMPLRIIHTKLKVYPITLVLLILFLMPAIANARIIYVDASKADDNGDGLSWQTAKKYLQSALALANSGDEIWVAKGTYYPDEGTGQTDNNRNSTFQLKEGVSLYGGFVGGETSLDQRNWTTNPTILNGDLDQSGGKTDNDAYHVVTGATNAVLDGFTITGGNANSSWPNDMGGGMVNSSDSSPTVTNCTFSQNSAIVGGGMYNSSSPTVTNCAFSSNSTHYGGGMYNSSSSPTVTNCTFSSNSADAGGGMYNDYSSPMVTNCIFSSNSVSYLGSGGGMCNNSSSSPTVTNCTFSSNSAGPYGGGGMCNDSSSSPTVTNCTFSQNSALYYGGGMRNNYYSSPTVVNCTFSSNSAYYGGGMGNDYFSSPTVTNCTFSRNSATSGGGMHNHSSSPTVTNCTFSRNSATSGGGMGNYKFSSPTVTNCILWEDSGVEIYNESSAPIVTYCDVEGGYIGTGNINADPMFTNPDVSDFTLQYNSPCIDAGKNPYAYDETINHDSGWKEDMGAYEYSGVRVRKSVSGTGEILFGGQVRAKVNVTILGTLSAIDITVHPGETRPDTPASVRRWFSVTVEGENATFDITLSYKDSELTPLLPRLKVVGFYKQKGVTGLNGETEDSLNLWRWTGEAWEGPKTPASRSPGDNYLLVNSQTAFSDWVISEALEPQRLPGDVSGNGSVTAYDASLVLQYVVGLRELSDKDRDVADVTGNGNVTALDAALILQYTVGLITQFPVESKFAASQRNAGETGAPTLEAISERLSEKIVIVIAREQSDRSNLLCKTKYVRFAHRRLRLTEIASSFRWRSTPRNDTFQTRSEEAALRKTIAQLEAATLNQEQRQVLEQLKRFVSQKLLPARTALFQNYPNPFNPDTWLPYQLATDAPVTIRIYNINGRLIRTLNLGLKPAGVYLTKEKAACWDGRDNFGEKVSSGVYYYTLRAGDFTATRKMVIMK